MQHTARVVLIKRGHIRNKTVLFVKLSVTHVNIRYIAIANGTTCSCVQVQGIKSQTVASPGFSAGGPWGHKTKIK